MSAHLDPRALRDSSVLPSRVDIYDTTLRDGSQQERISLTVDDKLRVARQLDHLGVAYIEGGWPGANPKDEQFFERARDELSLERAQLVAFGSTRRANSAALNDPAFVRLLQAGTDIVCIVAKAAASHVRDTLRTTPKEAIAMVTDSVQALRDHGLRVFLDAEHFFDGFEEDRDFSLRLLAAAELAGAEALVLCDTNGGMLPGPVSRVVADVRSRTSCVIGVHFHNDSGCAVANSLSAVGAGATHVQGCINGYGERAGNADLCAAIPNLTLKLGIETIPRDRIKLITPVARHLSELVNINLDPQKPYVGSAAFAHKAGLHTSANARRAGAYEHVEPDAVGNGSRVVVSELSGRATIEARAKELGVTLDSDALEKILQALKTLEFAGYHFEVADGSLELLMRAAADGSPANHRPFEIESFRVITDWVSTNAANAEANEDVRDLVHPWGTPGRLTTEATVKVHVGDDRVVSTAEGNGPVHALDAAIRQAIGQHFPELSAIHLTDYRVRVLDSHRGTGAITRVLIDTAGPDDSWSTMGVSENIIEASWQALVDSLVYALTRTSRANVAELGEH
ncbi:MAG: citramalate synthase [Acidimicrobiales bacterium]